MNASLVFRTCVVLAAMVLTGCLHGSYFLPGPVTEPQELSPGAWENSQRTYRVELYGNGTGVIIGYRGSAGGWVEQPSSGSVDRPTYPRTEIRWSLSPTESRSTASVSFVAGNYFSSLSADGHAQGHWGALRIYPCGDPDACFDTLYKVAEYPHDFSGQRHHPGPR